MIHFRKKFQVTGIVMRKFVCLFRLHGQTARASRIWMNICIGIEHSMHLDGDLGTPIRVDPRGAATSL